MDDGADTYARYSGYLDQFVQVWIERDRVTRVAFRETVDESVSDAHDLLDRIDGYLTGTITEEFADVSVAPMESTIASRVYTAVRSIPYGTDASVEMIEQTLYEDDPSQPVDPQEIRQALLDNPIPIIIPDHRVRDGPSGAPPIVEQRLRALEAPGT